MQSIICLESAESRVSVEKMSKKLTIVCVVLSIWSVEIIRADQIVRTLNFDKSARKLTNFGDKMTNNRNFLNKTKSSLPNVAAAIKEHQFERANALIEMQQMTASDWNYVVCKISRFGNETMHRFGKFMKFDTNKLLFYIELWKFHRSQPNDDNVYLQFLSVEDDILSTIQDLFHYAYGLNKSPLARTQLETIHWDKLVEAEKPCVGERKLLIIQRLLNRALVRLYLFSGVDAIDQIQQIKNDSENNKIFKTLFYGALRYVQSQRTVIDIPYVYQLAYTIRDHIKSVRHELARDYFDTYLKWLANSFHGCIRNIVNESNGNKFFIKNVKYDEYIHADHHYWGIYGTIFTCTRKSMSRIEQFLLEFKYNHFWIKSVQYPERYVDSFHAPIAVEYSPEIAIQIIPSDWDDQYCLIQHWDTGKYMYADAINDEIDRHVVFSNGTREYQDGGYLWKFSSYIG